MADGVLRAIHRPKEGGSEYAAYIILIFGGCPDHEDLIDQLYFEGIRRKTLQDIEADLKQLSALGDRDPVHLEFMGDPYDAKRNDHVYVRAILGTFRENMHPFQILTEGGTKASQDFDLYFEGCRFGCRLTCDNDEDSLRCEPNAALPADRVEALSIAHEMGINTWALMEPVRDAAQTLHMIELTHPYVDYYVIGKAGYPSIDWHRYRLDVEELLKRLGKNYSIRASLRRVA